MFKINIGAGCWLFGDGVLVYTEFILSLKQQLENIAANFCDIFVSSFLRNSEECHGLQLSYHIPLSSFNKNLMPLIQGQS